MTTITDNSLIDIVEAAKFLSIDSIETVRKLARNGQIPAGKVGKEWRFSRVDLEEHLRSQYKPKESAEIEPCHSTNAKIRRTGGSKLNSTADQYQKALGLTTARKRKNITTN